jgi:hypothetical protein
LEEDEAATFLDLFFILSFIGHVAVNCDHDWSDGWRWPKITMTLAP